MVGFLHWFPSDRIGTFTASMAGDLGAAAAQSTGESLLKMPTLAGGEPRVRSKEIASGLAATSGQISGNLVNLVEVEAQF